MHLQVSLLLNSLSETELHATIVDNKRKIEIYKTQEFSQADVLRINSEKQELLRQIDSLEKENNSIDQQAWDLEMKVNKSKEKVTNFTTCKKCYY